MLILVVALGLSVSQLRSGSATSQPAAEHPLENLVFVEPDVITGSAPLDEAAFEQLAVLGVRTIISVEALPPDLRAAARHGMRYVHLPTRYNGLTPDELLRLAYALHTVERPVYVHCFHGRHRAPAAVAAAEVVLGRLSPAQALDVLEQAGTSPRYPGLFAAIDLAARLDPESIRCAAGPLPARVEPEPFLLAMGQIDRSWNALWRARQRDWQTDADARALAALARQLADELRTAAGHVPPQWQHAGLEGQLAASARRAARLAGALEHGRRSEASRHADRLRSSCTRCHAETRNGLVVP